MSGVRGGDAVARAAFALLVLATLAALLITQRLKHSLPLLQNPQWCSQFDPGIPRTCVHTEHIDFTLTVDEVATVTIRTAAGATIATPLATTVVLRYHRQLLRWDGRDSAGHAVPRGSYTAWIALEHHQPFEIAAFRRGAAR